MASTVFRNLSPQTQGTNQASMANSLVNQILGAANPQLAFNQMLSNNKDAKAAMDIVNQYGNGDPKAAFMNYASSKGQNALAQTIMSNLGLS